MKKTLLTGMVLISAVGFASAQTGAKKVKVTKLSVSNTVASSPASLQSIEQKKRIDAAKNSGAKAINPAAAEIAPAKKPENN